MENGELHIRFHYRPAGKKKQAALNQEAVETIFAQQGFDDWLALLKTPAPTEKNPSRTLLEKHLNDYTARNTFDYFIHKDLGGFLRRELDLPKAQVTVDWFHIVQTFTRALDDVRKAEGRVKALPKHLRWAVLNVAMWMA